MLLIAGLLAWCASRAFSSPPERKPVAEKIA
jgi:hypothetical protein